MSNEHTEALNSTNEAMGSAPDLVTLHSNQSATESDFSHHELGAVENTHADDKQAILGAQKADERGMLAAKKAAREAWFVADATEMDALRDADAAHARAVRARQFFIDAQDRAMDAAAAADLRSEEEDGARLAADADELNHTARDAFKMLEEAESEERSTRILFELATKAREAAKATADRTAAEFEEYRSIAHVQSEINQIRQQWIHLIPKNDDELSQQRAILSAISLIIESNSYLDDLLKDSDWRAKIEELMAPLHDTDTHDAAFNDNLGQALRLLHSRFAERGVNEARLNRIRSAISQQDERSLALRQAESLKRIENAEREATGAAESAKKAAGTAGDAALTGHFASYAAKEYRRSYLYLAGAITSLLAAIAAAGFVVWGGDAQDLGWREALRAIVSLPLVGLAYFLSRESSIHSQSARRAHEIEVRLATIEAFTQVMAEPDRQDLRNKLGILVFSNTDLVKMQDTNNLGKETTEALDTLKTVASAASKEIAESSKKILEAGKS